MNHPFIKESPVMCRIIFTLHEAGVCFRNSMHQTSDFEKKLRYWTVVDHSCSVIPKKNWCPKKRLILHAGIVIPPWRCWRHSLKIAVLTPCLWQDPTRQKTSVLLESLQLIKHPSGTFAHSFPWKSFEICWQPWALSPFLHFSKPLISVWKDDEQIWQSYWIL